MPTADQRADVAGRLEHLDLLRGGAALLVCTGHLRAFLFVNLSSIASPTVVEYGFYAVTALGHQAVIAFFALSGYLVGGGACKAILDGRFVWRDYILRRLTRLWVVIIPALFLTLLLDALGLALSNGAGYAGSYYAIYNSGPELGGADHSVLTFLGNVFFLQTILTPTFGSNTPLWSLANEFWYYFMFPLGAFAIFADRRKTTAILCGGAGILIALWLPWQITLLGAIWLFGAAGFMATPSVGRLSGLRYGLCAAATPLLIAGGLVLSVVRHDVAGDIALGAAFAAALPVLATLPRGPRAYRAVTLGTSDISYTLYVVHFPFLAFVFFSTMAPQRMTLGASGAAIFVLLLAVTLLVASGFWWCFERNTGRVRAAVKKALARRRATVT